MQPRQLGTPILLGESAEGDTRRLTPIPVGAPPFREDGLQQLLAQYPEALPIDEIEPTFGPLILLGREIPTPSGALDLLYTSPEGHLTLVETKLWDNPEARREVVGQVIDYAKDFSRWSFDDLNSAVQSVQAGSEGLIETIRRHDPDVDEANLIDNISRDLRRGRFLLIVAGNGIREGVEEMTSYLQQTPSLHFSLAMVELSLYRMAPDQEWPLLVQPRTIARTVEIERAIVTVNAPEDVDVDVTLPAEDESSKRRARRTLSEEEFYEELAANTSSSTADAVRELCAKLEKLGVTPVWRASSISMRLPDPDESGDMITIVVLQKSGTFFLGWLDRIAEKHGHEPVDRYRDTVVEMTGAERAPKWDGTKECPVDALVDQMDEFVQLVGQFIDDLEAKTTWSL